MADTTPTTDTDRDPIRSIEDLPAPRAPEGGAPSQASVGAANADPTADRTAVTPAPAEPNPTAPAEGDPLDQPRDDTPPVGTSAAGAMGGLLDREGIVNPADPDGPDESDADGMGPADAPRDQGLAAESAGPGGTPPLG